MANTFGKTQMAVLWDEVASTTDMNRTLSKDLDFYNPSALMEEGRTATDKDVSTSDTFTNQQDQEWIPQEYRFNVTDGIDSSSTTISDLTDRYIPVRRNRAQHIVATLNTKDLRDPQRRKKKIAGMARELANAVDIFAYQTMIDQASMVVTSTSDFAYTDAIAAENLMLNRGLSGYNKKLFLSNPHYQEVAESLGANQYYGAEGGKSITADALERAYIPNLATFNTMRSDYITNLAANTTSGLTVNGAQSHTIATNGSAGFFQDNRSMTLNITGNTPTNFPIGTKFTIAGVNALNEETRTDNGALQTFTVIGTGTGTAVIQPAIVISPSPYANCSAQAGAAAAIAILNNVQDAPSLFYTPESTVIVPGILPPPPEDGGVGSVEATTEQGLPMRLTWNYDLDTEVYKCKALIYYDVQVIYPNQLGVILDNQT